MSLQSRTYGDFARETRERRLRDIRQRIVGGTYETTAKLDAALDRMIDAEGFTSHPPMLRPDDAALNEWMDEQMQLQAETDR